MSSGDDVVRLITEAEEEVGNLEQHSALDHIDLFRSGFVAAEDGSLRITEDGSFPPYTRDQNARAA
jgi:hypothetical protein